MMDLLIVREIHLEKKLHKNTKEIGKSTGDNLYTIFSSTQDSLA